MTTYTVPTTVTNPTSGTVLMPGHPSYTGADVTDALTFWLASTLDADGFTTMSGTSTVARNTIVFQPATYSLEYGTVWGLSQNQQSYTDRSGLVWPIVKQHAWRNVIIDGNGATWQQLDNTTHDDGIVPGTADTIAGDGTVVTLATPLTVGQVARLRATSGATPSIDGTKSDNTNQLFTRKAGTGGVGTRAQIGSCADDGTIVTLAAGNTCNETRSGAPINIYLGVREGRRNDRLWMFATASPGAKNGVERTWVNHDVILRNLTIRMGNTTGAISVFTEREQWHCFRLRGIDGLTIESSVRGEDVWGDIINTGSTSQLNLANVPLHVENTTIAGVYTGCGRHAITGQGHIGLDVTNAVFRDIGRLFWDSETTSPDARVLDTTISDVVYDPGTVAWHQSPATLHGEPPRTVTVTTVSGSDRIAVPHDAVNGDDLGSFITATGIPATTYLRRRMSPTEMELSAPAIADGTVTALLGAAVPFRDFTMRYADNWSTPGNFAGNVVCPASRVYFVGNTTAGSPTVIDVAIVARADGLTFIPADFVGVKVGSLGAGVFALPVSNNLIAGATSTTVTMPTNALLSTSPDFTLSATVIAGDRTLTTVTPVFTTEHKGHTVTGPGIAPDTFIATVTSGKNIELSAPAIGSNTVTVTVDGRARFFSASGPAEWTGYTIENCRNIGTGKWGGSSIVWQLPDQPLIMFPEGTDQLIVQRNYGVAARNNANAVVRTMVGSFVSPNARLFGQPPSAQTWTSADNRWIDALDNQAATPTVTSAVTLTGTGLTTVRPTFTAQATFSDARQERGGIAFYRDGVVLAGAAPIVAGTATFTPFVDQAAGIHLWTAKWVGSWDTLGATSNTVTQNVGGATPTVTTTTLTVAPTSPQNEGVAETLTATVAPDPSDGSPVDFYDDATLLGSATTTAGVATLPATFTAGTHPLSAVFAGTPAFQASSGTSTFVANAVISDTTPPTASVTPADGTIDVDPTAVVSVTFSESVTDVAFELRLNDQSVSGAFTGASTAWTFTPDLPLDEGATYTIVLNDAIDLAGNHMAGRLSATFVTHDEHLVPLTLSRSQFFVAHLHGHLSVETTVPGH